MSGLFWCQFSSCTKTKLERIRTFSKQNIQLSPVRWPKSIEETNIQSEKSKRLWATQLIRILNVTDVKRRTDQEVDKYLQIAITLAQTDKKINNNKKKQNKTKTSKLFKLKITSKHSPTKNWAQGGDLFRLVRNAYWFGSSNASSFLGWQMSHKRRLKRCKKILT